MSDKPTETTQTIANKLQNIQIENDSPSESPKEPNHSIVELVETLKIVTQSTEQTILEELQKSIIKEQELDKKPTPEQIQKLQNHKDVVRQRLGLPPNTSHEPVASAPPGVDYVSRGFVCDGCKECEEFESAPNIQGTCSNCGCSLICHIKNGEEFDSEDDDAQEWKDSDDDGDDDEGDEENGEQEDVEYEEVEEYVEEIVEEDDNE